MAKETAGKLVEVTDKDGKTSMAIARNVDQRPEFTKVQKIMLRFINEDMSPKKDEKTGKELVGLRGFDKCRIIGYVD